MDVRKEAVIRSTIPKEQYKEAVSRLLDWQSGGTSFSCGLFNLFQKADQQNTMKLAMSYPVEYQALLEWRKKGDNLFKEYGLIEGI